MRTRTRAIVPTNPEFIFSDTLPPRERAGAVTRLFAKEHREHAAIRLRSRNFVPRPPLVTDAPVSVQPRPGYEAGPASVVEEIEAAPEALLLTLRPSEEQASTLAEGGTNDGHAGDEEILPCESQMVQGPVEMQATLSAMATCENCPACGQRLTESNPGQPPTEPVCASSSSTAEAHPSPEAAFSSQAPAAPPSRHVPTAQSDSSVMNQGSGVRSTGSNQKKRAAREGVAQAGPRKRAKKTDGGRDTALTNEEFCKALKAAAIVVRSCDVEQDVLDGLEADQKSTISRKLIVWVEGAANPPPTFVQTVTVVSTGQTFHLQHEAYPRKLFARCRQLNTTRIPFFLTFFTSKPSDFAYRGSLQALVGNCSSLSFGELVAFLVGDQENTGSGADDIAIDAFENREYEELCAHIKTKSQQLRLRFIFDPFTLQWPKVDTRQKFVNTLGQLDNVSVICDDNTAARYKEELVKEKIRIIEGRSLSTRNIAGVQCSMQALLHLWSTAEMDVYTVIFFSLGPGSGRGPYRVCQDRARLTFVLNDRLGIARILKQLARDFPRTRTDDVEVSGAFSHVEEEASP